MMDDEKMIEREEGWLWGYGCEKKQQHPTLPDGSPLAALDHYCRSPQAYQRLAYAQGIAAAAAAAAAHEYGGLVEVLLPLVEHMARDHEAEIRAAVVKQMHGLGAALHARDAERGMRDIEATLLVCAQQCALDDEDEVSQASVLAFQQLVQLLPPARATAASKRAVDRLESQGTDEGALAAVRLLAHTVSCWTPEALRRHVPRYVSRWACHRDFAIREGVATCMSLILPPMPPRLRHQALLPACYQLAHDQNWRVRRACALDLPRLAQALQAKAEQQHDAAARGSSSGSSSSSWHEAAAGDALGQCSSKASSCASSGGDGHHSHSSGGGHSQSTANLLAAGAGAAHGRPQRNRSFPSLVARPPAPATSAQIMTKHPMHSSLIMDSLLAGASPDSHASCPSTRSGPGGLLAQQDSADEAEVQAAQAVVQQQQQDDDEQDGVQQQQPASQELPPPQQEQPPQPSCSLDQAQPLLHDCWCILRQCMELLTADSSHWVKVAALSGLGPFLLRLPHCQVGQLLLGRFTSMAGSTVVIYEVSVALACAQAFGRLAVLLGPERWADVRDAWHALQASRDPQVLCEVVACLPALVSALGPALTQQELVPALAALLQSHLGWVGAQLVVVVADLLERLPPNGQELLLKTLPQLCGATGERGRSWRLRRDLAQQLGRMAAATGPEAVEQSLWPAAMCLCQDPVAAVRMAAAAQVGAVLAALPAGVLQQQLVDQGSGWAACGGCSSSSNRAVSTAADTAAAAAAQATAACSSSSITGCDGPSTPPAASPSSCAWDADAAGTSSDQEVGGASEPPSASGTASASSGPSTSSERSPRRRSSKKGGRKAGVRFADSPAEPNGASSSTSSRHAGFNSSGVLAGLVASGALAAGGSSSSISSASRNDVCHTSGEYDLELPSALAPAAVGCFGSQGDDSSAAASDNDDAADAPASSSSSSTCSGLSSSSTSSSRSSHDAAELCCDGHGSGSRSGSDDDEEYSDASEEENDAAAAGGLDWDRSSPSPQPQEQQEQQGAGRQGTPQPFAADGYYTPGSSHAPPPRPALAMHPAMMPVGAVASTAAAAAATPRAVPDGRGGKRHQRTRSAGDLLRLATSNSSSAAQLAGTPVVHRRGGGAAGAAPAHASPRRHASAHSLGRSLPTGRLLGGGSSDDDDARLAGAGRSRLGCCLPLPADAAPHQYLACLVHYFGRSRSFQERQLFVPLVLGLLASCHEALSCSQQAALLDRLEALAHDKVAGVRYAVAVALADVKAQAAGLAGAAGAQPPPQQQQQVRAAEQPLHDAVHAAQAQQHTLQHEQQALPVPTQQQEQQEPGHPFQQQQQQPLQEDASQFTAPGVPKGAHPLLGYQAYVAQLSKASGSPTTSSTSTTIAAAAAAAATAINIATPPRAPAAAGRADNSSSSAAAAQQQAAVSTSAPVASSVLAAGSRARRNSSGSSTRPPLPAPRGGDAAAASSPVEEAAAAGPQDDAAAQEQPAEWLRKLSNCQQLERLLHVGALTAGPAC